MLGTLSIYAAERAEKRWILGALGIAILLHAILFSAFGFYHLRGMEIPANHSDATGPFTVKQVEISADAFKPDQPDPTTKLPQPEPPKNPAEFNLDPSAVQKSLQTPLPKLSAPAVPEPDRVIASVDLGHDMPYVESDSAKITAEINHTDPSTAQASPVSTSQLAQEVISSSGGLPHPGVTPGVNIQGDGAANKVPGFGDLASGFRPADSALSKLPEPVLLRLPADVLFDFDSADLKSQADPLLAQAVTMITKYPAADIQIDGYSDSFGKPDYDQKLSEQRAAAVQAWMQDHAPSSGYNFRSQGHGSTNFIVPTSGSIEQQQPNRRVEILIQALKTQ